MASKPLDPKALGRGIRGKNPRFNSTPTQDVKAPPGGYQSTIGVGSPIDTGKQKQITDVKSPVSELTSYRKDAGSQSLSAFARGLTDTSKNALDRSLDKYDTQFRKQAEKSRSEDILAQRQNSLDEFRQDMFKDIFDMDTGTRYSQSIQDLNQYFTTEQKNEKNKRAAMWMKAMMSMI